MTSSEFSKSIIALACWSAARGELYSVMLAVGMVFRNRALAGWYGGDLYENGWRYLEEFGDQYYPDTRDPQFEQLLAKIGGLISGAIPDRTDGALWFFCTTEPPEKIAGTITTKIGNLTFVR